MLRKTNFLLAIHMFVVGGALLGTAFADPKPEDELAEIKRHYEQRETRLYMDESLEAWEREHLWPALNSSKAEINTLGKRLETKINMWNLETTRQDETSKAELGALNERSKNSIENSERFINVSMVILAVLALLVSFAGVVGIISYRHVKELEKEVKDEIENAKTEAESSRKNMMRIQIFAKEDLKKIMNECMGYVEECKKLVEKGGRLIEALKTMEKQASDDFSSSSSGTSATTNRDKDISSLVADSTTVIGILVPNKDSINAADVLINQPEAQAYLRSYAIRATKDEDWQEALGFWERVLKDETAASDALFYVTLCLNFILQNERSPKNPLWKKVHAYYERAVKILPEVAELWSNWAILLKILGDISEDEEKQDFWKKANKYYKKSTDLSPNYAAAWSN